MSLTKVQKLDRTIQFSIDEILVYCLTIHLKYLFTVATLDVILEMIYSALLTLTFKSHRRLLPFLM